MFELHYAMQRNGNAMAMAKQIAMKKKSTNRAEVFANEKSSQRVCARTGERNDEMASGA